MQKKQSRNDYVSIYHHWVFRVIVPGQSISETGNVTTLQLDSTRCVSWGPEPGGLPACGFCTRRKQHRKKSRCLQQGCLHGVRCLRHEPSHRCGCGAGRCGVRLGDRQGPAYRFGAHLQMQRRFSGSGTVRLLRLAGAGKGIRTRRIIPANLFLY
jgi:hypothetical protein